MVDMFPEVKHPRLISGVAFLALAVAFAFFGLIGFTNWYVYEELSEPHGTSAYLRLLLLTFGGTGGFCASLACSIRAFRRK
jgi:hypothetical protein